MQMTMRSSCQMVCEYCQYSTSQTCILRKDDIDRSADQENIQWEKQIPIEEKPQMEKIIDQRISKKTRRKTYFEYLVKWKGHPIEDSNWENEAAI